MIFAQPFGESARSRAFKACLRQQIEDGATDTEAREYCLETQGNLRGFGDWLDDLQKQGIDPKAIWNTVATNAKDLVLKDLPNAAIKTVQEKAAATAAPVVQAVAQKKAERVVSKGNVALTAGIGLAAGLLVAGGSWQRRAVGGAVGGILGGLAGLKIGLVSDSA